jgi:diaminopimelate epimerase
MSFPFAKMQGAGNDFIVVRGEEHNWSALAPQICARHFGIGSDGILVALPSDRADVRMRMYNPDGTEDDCGNGIRCLALFAATEGMVTGPVFRIETLSGIKEVRFEPVGPTEARVSVEMGRPSLAPAAIPALVGGEDALGFPLPVDGETLDAYSVYTGTAHTVLFEAIDEPRFERLSPLLEIHPLFPERTSVLWSHPLAPDRFGVRIWERGVGETLACGTGACAVAVVAHATGRAGRRVEVVSRGGTLTIDIAADLSLRMTGPAAFVYRGVWG